MRLSNTTVTAILAGFGAAVAFLYSHFQQYRSFYDDGTRFAWVRVLANFHAVAEAALLAASVTVVITITADWLLLPVRYLSLFASRWNRPPSESATAEREEVVLGVRERQQRRLDEEAKAAAEERVRLQAQQREEARRAAVAAIEASRGHSLRSTGPSGKNQDQQSEGQQLKDPSREGGSGEGGSSRSGNSTDGVSADRAKGDSAKGDSAKGDSAKGDSAKGDSAKGDSAKGDSAKGDSAGASAVAGLVRRQRGGGRGQEGGRVGEAGEVEAEGEGGEESGMSDVVRGGRVHVEAGGWRSGASLEAEKERKRQDAAYAASLRRDREVEERRRREEEERRKEEEEQERRTDERRREEEQRRKGEEEKRRAEEERTRIVEERREHYRRMLPPEPGADVASEERVVVAVRLPDGAVCKRGWRGSDTIGDVYNWLHTLPYTDLLPVPLSRAILATPFPRRLLPLASSSSLSLADAELCPRAVLVVEEMGLEEEEGV
ncbi:hypothetical protein CLOP_g10961 [Closterium sp. NIES-67]|nr:hypothetical protein CLOP_g10961 [Closterium sp. NIES-67]